MQGWHTIKFFFYEIPTDSFKLFTLMVFKYFLLVLFKVIVVK